MKKGLAIEVKLKKILQLNYIDTPGDIFNGNALNAALKEKGYEVTQIVKTKLGEMDWVKECPGRLRNQRNELQRRHLEEKFGMDNLETLCGKEIMNMREFQEADIVHLHILHNQWISLLDIPAITSQKRVVWTIHDPWIFTGKCIYPLNCKKWQTGCGKCLAFDRSGIKMLIDKTDEMWKVKKQIISKIEIDYIYSSDFMKRFFLESPIFKTLSYKKMHKIPFGVRKNNKNKDDIRQKWNISLVSCVIGFRYTEDEIKGVKYLIPLLKVLSEEIIVLTVENLSYGKLKNFHKNTIELGMCSAEKMAEFYAVCDLFLMPSLAESFGLMALEAMAAECVVVCFQGTVVEENCAAPEIGISVPYGDSDHLKNEVLRLIKNPQEIIIRGQKGKKLVQEKFKFETYVNRHIKLYQEICAL